MRVTSHRDGAAGERARAIADALRAEWRLIEEVTLRPRSGGAGYEALIELNQIVVRAAAEQQGFSPATRAASELRRRRAIAECVERLNATLPADDVIADFRVAD